MSLPLDLTSLHLVAFALLFAAWWLYSPILSLFGRGTLNAQLGIVRLRWMRLSTQRAQRPFDAILLNQIINSVAFFGSASLIVLAALLGTFANVSSVHAVLSQLHFVAPMSIELLAANLSVVVLILGISFFAFTYSLRKLIYTVALSGGLPDQAEETPQSTIQIEATATVLTEAVRSFNNGIRGYYYAVAALFLLLGPVPCIIATCTVMAMLFYRQTLTATARAIGTYVDAVNEEEKLRK
jgi:uncharacterized membrane protein